jgi:4-hydroxybenzoate polyprenyltransferase
MKIKPYLKLMRLDKPVGCLLLLIPTLMALFIASTGLPSYKLLLIFTLGTIVTRSLGCVINDVVDRNIDPKIARTKLRPLAAKTLSLNAAIRTIILLSLSACILVLNLNKICMLEAIIALVIMGVYPFCKRFFKAPQLVLGLAFSMGIPMAYSACDAAFDGSFYLLILINCIWVITYDTYYALCDIEDDKTLGVNSTAIFFGKYCQSILNILVIILHCIWLYFAIYVNLYWIFYIFWILAICVLSYQQYLIKLAKTKYYFLAFNISPVYGLLLLGGIICAK